MYCSLVCNQFSIDAGNLVMRLHPCGGHCEWCILNILIAYLKVFHYFIHLLQFFQYLFYSYSGTFFGRWFQVNTNTAIVNCCIVYLLIKYSKYSKTFAILYIVVYNYKLASAKRVTMSATSSSLSQHLEHSERCWLSGAGTQREWVISYILVGTARLMTRESLPDRGQPVCSWISAAHIVRLSHSAVRLSMWLPSAPLYLLHPRMVLEVHQIKWWPGEIWHHPALTFIK